MMTEINPQLIEANTQLVKGDGLRVSLMTGISRGACNIYLNGKGTNPETAMKVLEASQKIIRQRRKQLEQISKF